MTDRSLAIRLAVIDGGKVKAELRDVGETGSRSLHRIEQASQPASRALLALNGVTGEVGRSLDGLSSRTGALAGVFRALGPAGVAAGAAVGAAVLGIGAAMDRARTAIDRLDKLDDIATKLGVAAEGLQALRFAFQNNGVAAEVTDAAIEKLNDCIGQMANLGDKAPQTVRRAFAQLGVEVRDTSGRIKSAEEVLAEMADGIAALGSQAERVQIARALMGRGGAALLPLLQQGTGSLRAMTDEARNLGVVVDEHLVKAASLAADKLDAMRQQIDSNLDQAFLDLTPLILDTAKAFAVAAGWVAKLADSFRDLENRSTRGLKQQLADINTELERPSDPNIDRLGLFGVAEDPAAAGAYRRSLEEKKRRLEAQIKAREEAANSVQSSPGPGPGDDTGGDRIDKAAARAVATNARVLADLRRQLETFGDERQQSIDRALARLSDGATEQARAEVERLAGELYDEAAAARAAAKGHDELAKATKKAAEESRDWNEGATRALADYADDAGNAARAAEDAVSGSFSGMGDALGDFVSTGKVDFAALVDSMIADLTRLVSAWRCWRRCRKRSGAGSARCSAAVAATAPPGPAPRRPG